MKIVFATHNQNKLKEVQKLVPEHIRIVSLTDIGCNEEIEESGTTLQENAILKADYITNTYGLSCFADDTGLLVDALNGRPGVYSARYAGEQKNADDNMDLLLKELTSEAERTAHFKTIITLNINGEQHVFEGKVEGEIINHKLGNKGFGYDPIFKPLGYTKTFAQLPLEIKNTISHRGIATQQLITFLNQFEHATRG